jgi:hypothetical protein
MRSSTRSEAIIRRGRSTGPVEQEQAEVAAVDHAVVVDVGVAGIR